MHRIKIDSTQGDVIICDSETKPVAHQACRSKAKEHRFLCFTTDDEYTYDIGLQFEPSDDSEVIEHFETSGGYMGVSIVSGKLIVTTSNQWQKEEAIQQFSVEPGEYMVEFKYNNEFEYDEYLNHISELAGSEDVAYSEWVDKLGRWAWLPTLIFIFGLLFTNFREIWYYALLVVLVSWLPYALLTKTSRYKRVEQVKVQYSQQHPNQLIVFHRLPDGQSLPGGYVFVQ